MRCYRITWSDIYGREWVYLVISDSDLSAESKIQSTFKHFRQILKTEYLPFDRIIHTLKF